MVVVWDSEFFFHEKKLELSLGFAGVDANM